MFCVFASSIQVYLRSLCWNFSSVVDSFGRSVLHAAASTGCVELVEWLIDVYRADPNQGTSQAVKTQM